MKPSKKIKILLRKDGEMCQLCKVQFTAEELKTREVNVDHKIPRLLGGSDFLENLQVTHRRCNTLKGLEDVKKWQKQQI